MMTKNILSDADRQKAFDAREIKDEYLNGIFKDAMTLVGSTDLGAKILAAANYKDAVGEKSYAQARENHVFAVEKAYVGIPGKVKGGHCGLISAQDNDKTYENARGEVYINADFIRNAAENMGGKKAAVYLSNLLVHEFTHGVQRTKIANEPENSKSRPVEAASQEAARKPAAKHDPRAEQVGWARMMLVEAGAMAAGLSVLCSLNPDREIKDYAVNDLENLGHLKGAGLSEMTGLIEGFNSGTEGERQDSSRKMLNTLIKGQQEFFAAQNPPVNVDFNRHLDLVKTVYQKDIFGRPGAFAQAIPGLTKESMNKLKYSLDKTENSVDREKIGLMKRLGADTKALQAGKANGALPPLKIKNLKSREK